MANRSIRDLTRKGNIDDKDYLLGLIDDEASRIPFSVIKTICSDWGSISEKPFSNINTEFFINDAASNNSLTLNPSVVRNINHTNRSVIDKFGETTEGKLTYNGKEFTVSSSWNTVSDKPFNEYSLGDFEAADGTLKIKATIKNDFHRHENFEILDSFSTSEGKLLWNDNPIAGEYDLPIASDTVLGGIKVGDGLTISEEGILSTTNQGGGIDFSALSNALTSGLLSGILIEANTENENFNFTVDGIPDVEINTTAIESGNQVTFSAKKGEETISEKTIQVMNGIDGRNGRDGISPTVSSEKVGNVNTVTFAYGEGQTEQIEVSDGEVNVKAVSYVIDVNVPLSGWSDSAPYTQTISVSSITSDSSPIIDILLTGDQTSWNSEVESYSCLNQVETSDRQITLYCVSEKPKSDFKIQMRIFGDAAGVDYVTREEFNELKELISGLNARLENVLNGGNG